MCCVDGSNSIQQRMRFCEYRTAAQEAKTSLSSDCSLLEARLALRALAKHHEYSAWREAFLRSQERFPSLEADRDIHEDLAASLLQKILDILHLPFE